MDENISAQDAAAIGTMVGASRPMYVGGFGNNGNGLGDFGGAYGLLYLIIALAMFGGGFGGFGGMGGGFGSLFPWMFAGQSNLGNQINDGFDNAALASGVNTLNSNVQNGFAGVNATVNSAQNALAQQLYTNQLADLERSFAAQTANTQGLNALQGQLAQCCCDNQLATVQTQNVVQSEAAANRAAGAANTQAILDKLCQLELDGVKSDLNAAQRENAMLQNQLNMAAFRADNVAQTAAIERSQADQTQYIVNRVAPYPVPAYPVSNPYGCGGYGYNNGFGWNNGFNPFGNVGFGNGSF